VKTPRVGGLIDAAAEGLSGQLFERAAALAFPEDRDHEGGRSAPGMVISKIQPSAAAAGELANSSR
jgi:hypothetical protein